MKNDEKRKALIYFALIALGICVLGLLYTSREPPKPSMLQYLNSLT